MDPNLETDELAYRKAFLESYALLKSNKVLFPFKIKFLIDNYDHTRNHQQIIFEVANLIHSGQLEKLDVYLAKANRLVEIAEIVENYTGSCRDYNSEMRKNIESFLLHIEDRKEFEQAKEFVNGLSVLAQKYHVKGTDNLLNNIFNNILPKESVEERRKELKGLYFEVIAAFSLIDNGFNIKELSSLRKHATDFIQMRREIDIIATKKIHDVEKTFYIEVKSSLVPVSLKREQIKALVEISKNENATPVIVLMDTENFHITDVSVYRDALNIIHKHTSLGIWNRSGDDIKDTIIQKCVSKAG